MNKYDSMIACNKKASEEKVNRAVTEIRQMLTEREKVTVPKLTKRIPNCPAADFIMEDVRQKVDSVEGVTSSVVNLVFEPEWDKDMMSEEAKLELGFL